MEKAPDAVAVVFEDRQLTYRDLNVQANRLAHHLIELGVGPETLVGLCVERSPEMIVGMLAVLKAGGAYVPLETSMALERLVFVVADARLKRATRGANDGLWELNVATREIWVSERYAEMLGFEPREFAGNRQKFFEVLYPEDAARLRDAMERCIRDDVLVDMEVRARTRSGEQRWHRIRGALERDATGAASTVSGSQRDITQRQQYALALLEATETAAAPDQEMIDRKNAMRIPNKVDRCAMSSPGSSPRLIDSEPHLISVRDFRVAKIPAINLEEDGILICGSSSQEWSLRCRRAWHQDCQGWNCCKECRSVNQEGSPIDHHAVAPFSDLFA